MNKVLDFLGCLFVFPIMIFVIFWIPVNLIGLLFGFENPSPACKAYERQVMTRFERVLYPITGYACQEDAGLLQPYATNFIKYLNEVPNDETK